MDGCRMWFLLGKNLMGEKRVCKGILRALNVFVGKKVKNGGMWVGG